MISIARFIDEPSLHIFYFNDIFGISSITVEISITSKLTIQYAEPSGD